MEIILENFINKNKINKGKLIVNKNKINKGKLIVDVSFIMKMLLNKKKFVETIGKLKNKNKNTTLREKTNLSNSNKNVVCNFLKDNIIKTQVVKVLLNGNKENLKKNDVIYQFVYDLIGIFDDKYKIICNFKYDYDDNEIKFNCTLFLQEDFGKKNFLFGKNIISNIVSNKDYDIKNKIEIYTYFYGDNTNKITSIDVLSGDKLSKIELKFTDLNNVFKNTVSKLIKNESISNVQKEINKDNNDIIIIPDLNGNYMTLLRILKRLFYIGKINENFILDDVKIIIIGKTFGNNDKYIVENKILFLTIYNLIMNNSGKVFWVKDDNDESNSFVRNNQNIKEYYKKLPYVIMIKDKDNDISINKKKNLHNKYEFMINTYCVSSYSYINKIIYKIEDYCDIFIKQHTNGRKISRKDYDDLITRAKNLRMTTKQIDRCLKNHKIEIEIVDNIKTVDNKKMVDKNKNETYCDRFIDEYTENGKIERKDYNGLTTNRQTKILKMSKEQIDKCLKKYEIKIVDKNKELFKYIQDNHIKYFILSSENNHQINSLRSSNSKYVNDLNLKQDIYDAKFIFRFGNGDKINGASTIINDDAKFWWGEEAPYMKEILEFGKNKNNSKIILDFITEKINGLNRTDFNKYKNGVVENIFLNRYYPILFTTNREYFDNFIVIRKNDIGKENKISNTNTFKNNELNSFFNKIFNGINVINNKNIKQFIVNEGVSVSAPSIINKSMSIVNKSIAVTKPVNINTNCPGSTVGIENRNIKNGNNGGKVYCYLNSLMQMLYCMEELRNNTFFKSVFNLLSGEGNSLVNINKNKNNNSINNQYIPAGIIIDIYKGMYQKKNILRQHSPSEFLLYTFANKNINFITKNKDSTININLTFYNDYNNFKNEFKNITDKKKYMFININKVSSKNKSKPISNFASLEIKNIYKNSDNTKFSYKLIGAIFYIDNNHYTFASYDNEGNVCRYYNDKFIYGSLPDDITLEKNAMILLYKEVSHK